MVTGKGMDYEFERVEYVHLGMLIEENEYEVRH